MLKNQDVEYVQGDTFTITVILNVDAPPPFNPVGSVGHWTLSRYATSDALLVKTTTTGDVTFVQDPVTQLYAMVVSLTKEDTEALPPGFYFHTAKVIETGVEPYTVMRGAFKLVATPDP